MEITIKIIILLLAVVGAQCLIRKFVNYFDTQLDESDKHIRNYLLTEEGEKEIEERKYNLNDFYEESTGLFLIKEKKKNLNFITTIIGVIEIVLFGGLTFVLIQKDHSFSEILIRLATFAGVWIALKVFGNYQQWSGAVFGRTCFYIFFMGSILNITAAIIIGYIVTKLFL